MVLNVVSSNVVIAKVIDMFNIPSSEFITRCPVWISEFLGLTNNYLILTPTKEDITVSGYRGKLPCTIKVLRGMEYQNTRLPRLDAMKRAQYTTGSTVGPVVSGFNYVNTKTYDNGDLVSSTSEFDTRWMDLSNTSGHWYSLLSNNYFETSFDEGTITCHYKEYPKDSKGLPLIPDNEELHLAGAFYILWMLLSRGYKHQVYSLGNTHKHLDPYLMWEDHKLRAKNSVSAIDSDKRELYHQMFTTMIPSFNKWNEEML